MFSRILATLTILFVFPVFAFAAEATSSMQVRPVYPENQVPETKGYFDVNVQPGEQVTMHLLLTNVKDTPIEVRTEKSDAYTSPTGGIFYETEVVSEDTALLEDAVRLSDHMEITETVTIPANESLELPIKVTVPEADGETFLGGIRVTEVEAAKEGEENLGENEASFAINTETTYAVAIKLNIPQKSEAEFSIGTAGFNSANAQVFLEMTNKAQLIQENVEGTYSVVNSAGEELFSGSMTPFNMAPKSKIRYPFAWNHETLEDGTYTLVVNGKAGDQEFSAEESFAISSEEVQEYAEVVNPTIKGDQNGIPTWVWIAGAIVFGLLMFVLGRRKKPAAGKAANADK